MNVQLTAVERQIVESLWENDRPLTRQELLAYTEERTWNPSSIHLILNSLISKGVVRVANPEKNYGRAYEVTISPAEFIMLQIENVMPQTGAQEHLLTLIKLWFRRYGVTSALLDRLETLIQEERQILQREEAEE